MGVTPDFVLYLKWKDLGLFQQCPVITSKSTHNSYVSIDLILESSQTVLEPWHHDTSCEERVQCKRSYLFAVLPNVKGTHKSLFWRALRGPGTATINFKTHLNPMYRSRSKCNAQNTKISWQKAVYHQERKRVDSQHKRAFTLKCRKSLTPGIEKHWHRAENGVGAE